MSDTIATALVEGARIFGKVQRDKARYDYLASPPMGVQTASTPRRLVAPEETLPGVELKNFVERKDVGEGENEGETTHVLVVEHKEWLERKPVPLTPPTAEELAQEREDKKFVQKLWAGVAAVAVVVVGTVVVVESSRSKTTVVVEPTPEVN